MTNLFSPTVFGETTEKPKTHYTPITTLPGQTSANTTTNAATSPTTGGITQFGDATAPTGDRNDSVSSLSGATVGGGINNSGSGADGARGPRTGSGGASTLEPPLTGARRTSEAYVKTQSKMSERMQKLQEAREREQKRAEAAFGKPK